MKIFQERNVKKILLTSTAAMSLAACGTIGEDEAIATAAAMAAEAAADAAEEAMAVNPLLEEWTGPYDGVPQWQDYEVAQFDTAYERAIAAYLAEMDAIANNPEAPTFENTMVAAELAGQELQRVNAIFSVYSSNLATPEVQAVDKKWSPKLTAAYDSVTLNDAIFQRIKTLYDARDTLGELVFRTIVPRNVRVSEAPSYAMPVISYDPASKGSQAYRALAQEMVERLKQTAS